MIAGLDQVLRDAERHRRTMEVCAASHEFAATVADQFETKNVTVTYTPLPPASDTAFLILRDAEGEFLGSIGQHALDAILSPEIHPPWVLAETETSYDDVFAFLDDTIFTSFERSQMLATTREIEERAWRAADGNLYAGFQRAEALRSQGELYEELAAREDLAVHVFVAEEWADDAPAVPTTVSAAAEIGRTWFVVFDGGDTELDSCALVAEERQPDSFYGLWTYNPATVQSLVEYLEAVYDPE